MYLSVKQVSERLGVSRACVYEMVALGKLSHVRIGARRGTIRIAESALEEYLAGAAERFSLPKQPSPVTRTHKAFSHLDIHRVVGGWDGKARPATDSASQERSESVQ